MVSKVVKSTALIIAVGLFSTNLAIAVPKKFHEQGTHSAEDELALAREIAVVKAKLAEYKIAQSFLSASGDVAIVTAMGAVTGVLAGLIHSYLSGDLIKDFACLIPRDEFDTRTERAMLFGAEVGRISAFAFQGGISGFWLGIAGQAGSMPQMSKGKMALVLALQNAIAAALSVGADHIGMNFLESSMRDDAVVKAAIAQIPGQKLNRRELFSAFAMIRNEGDKLAVAGLSLLPIFAAQIVALLIVVPEAYEVWASRKSEHKKVIALQDALKKLELSMSCVEAEEALAK